MGYSGRLNNGPEETQALIPGICDCDLVQHKVTWDFAGGIQ